jgi:hypothetical protein
VLRTAAGAGVGALSLTVVSAAVADSVLVVGELVAVVPQPASSTTATANRTNVAAIRLVLRGGRCLSLPILIPLAALRDDRRVRWRRQIRPMPRLTPT